MHQLQQHIIRLAVTHAHKEVVRAQLVDIRIGNVEQKQKCAVISTDTKRQTQITSAARYQIVLISADRLPSVVCRIHRSVP